MAWEQSLEDFAFTRESCHHVQLKLIMNQFRIYVERLRDGQTETLKESFPSDFLEVHEKDLSFPGPVEIEGEAYIADEMLILHMDIKAAALIPCIICSEPVQVEIAIPGFYHAVPLAEIKTGVYSFMELLREIVLLETPSLAECRAGKCPQRQELQKYFKKEPSKGLEDEGYHPFNVL